jgi:hypothetical protein
MQASLKASRFTSFRPTQWQRMIDINLTGVFNTFSAGLAHMAGTGWGRMVAIASTAGLQGGGYISAYSASKHGVVGLVRSLAIELGPKDITVNAVCPGYIDTPMTDRTLDNITAKTGMSREEATKMLLKDVPTGRLVTADEVAGTVLVAVQRRSPVGQWRDGGDRRRPAMKQAASLDTLSPTGTASRQRLRVWLRVLKLQRQMEAALRDRLRTTFDTTLPRFDVLAALDHHAEACG